MEMNDVLHRFQNAMGNSGLVCSEPMPNTSTFQRFGMDGDKDKPCWYILTIEPNGFAVGSYGCFKRDLKGTWCSKYDSDLSIEDKRQIAARRKQIEEQHKAQQIEYWNEGVRKAKSIWSTSEPTGDDHPYLRKKQVKNFSLRVSSSGDLIVPVHDHNGDLHGLQFVSSDGAKRFLPGTNKKEHFYKIPGDDSIIFIAEGYATAATVHQATENTVVVAFDAGNLLSVAQCLRRQYPKQEIVIAADNDQFTPFNAGIQKSQETSKAIKAQVIFPQFKNLDSKPTDFNDLMVLEGLEEVQRQLSNCSKILEVISLEKDDQKTQASKIIELIKDVELFHDGQRKAYVTFENNAHQETWPLNSQEFQDWLNHQYWKKYRRSINHASLQNALETLQGQARYEGDCQEVYVRSAMVDGVIYIDLVNADWETVQVSADGWEIKKHSPIKFIRMFHMQALPNPIHDGNFDQFWKYCNIPEPYQKLVLAFILECFRPNTPYPLLVLSGIQGSAKSTTQELIRMLIDPSSYNLRSLSKKRDDLFVAAANNSLVSLNNISYLSEIQQDDLCCISTGGAHATRELYTTNQELVSDVKRPVIMNGIGDFITAQDLIDRCLILELPEIDEQSRKLEYEIKEQFSQQYPSIVGGLLDILCKSLRELSKVTLTKKPRMADFAMFGVAVEKAMSWETGSFIAAYENNRINSLTNSLDHSPVAIALIKFVQKKIWNESGYETNYKFLYEQLSSPRYKPDMAGWPKSPKGLANQIKRQKPALAAVGFEIICDSQRHEDGYHICIKKAEKEVQQVQDVQKAKPAAYFLPEHADE